MEFTPEYIDTLPDDGIFVFGSNTDGDHCGGAARVALKRFGAVNGQAEGPQGRSYAIPTVEYIEIEEDYTNRPLYQKNTRFASGAGGGVRPLHPLHRSTPRTTILRDKDRLRNRWLEGG